MTRPEVVYQTTPEEFTRSQWSLLEDDVLIECTLKGHALGFEILMERYSAMVTSFLYHKVHHPADAEDLAQEVFLTAYRGLGQLRKVAGFRSWLMQIARSRLIDYYRTQQRRPKLVSYELPEEEEGAVPLLERTPSPGPDSSQRAEQAQIRGVIMREIERLGERFSAVLTLRLIEEQSAEEIASHLGLAVTAVRMRIFHGLRRLRKALARQGIGLE